jgi:hypothetical protein
VQLYNSVSAKKDKGKWAILKPKPMTTDGWIVSLGMVDGKNVRRKFRTKEDAQDFCRDENANKKVDQRMPEGADGSMVKKWMALDAELKSAGVDSLVAVGRRVLRDAKSVTQTGSAQECFDACHKFHVDIKSRGTYRGELRNRCGRFLRYAEKGQPAWKDRPVLEITPEAIESYLETLPNKGDYKTISAWLGWAAKKRWLPKNPCTGKKPDAAPHGAVVTLSPAEAARMLRLAVETESWEVAAHVSISLFAGIRPSEFRKVAKGDQPVFLYWEYLKGEHFALPPELCKNGRRSGQGRTIMIEPPLAAWIKLLREKNGGILKGKVVSDNWKKAWETWRKEYWLDEHKRPLPWPKDQLRHSFGSYHLARGKSLQKTSFIMENSPRILKKHYWNWETLGSDAKIFWTLTPEKVLDDGSKEAKTTWPS